MKNEHNLDRLFREKLRHHEMDSPQHLWDNIQSSINIEDKKKNNGYLFWYSASILLLALSGFFLYQNFSSSATNSEASNNNLIDKEEALNSTYLTDNDSPTSDLNKSNIEPQEEIEKAKNAAQVSDNQNIINNNQIKETTQNKLISKEKININTAENTNTYTPAKIINTSSSSNYNSSSDLNISIKAAENTNVNNAQAFTEKLVIDKSNNTSNNNSSVSAYASSKQGKAEMAILREEDSHSSLFGYRNLRNLENKFKNRSIDGMVNMEGCKVNIDRSGRWFIEASFSPDLAFRSMNAVTADQDYIQQRELSEKFVNAFTLSTRVSYKMYNDFVVRAGLSYSQINERYDKKVGNQEKLVIIEKEVNGKIVKDTTITYGTLVKQYYNRHKFIDIPLMIGYEWDKKNYTLSANVGTNINVRYNSSGNMMFPDLVDRSFTNSSNSHGAYRDNVGVSLLASFGLHYNIKRDLQFVIEPKMQFFLNPVTAQGFGVEQKYLNVGLNLGLKQRL